MKAVIHELPSVNSCEDEIKYTVNSAEECRCKTSRSAYETAVKFNAVIRMGCVMVVPTY